MEQTTERKADATEKGVADVWRVDAETGRYLDGGSHWKTYGAEREEAVLCHDIAVKEGRFYVTNTPAGELYVGDKETGELLDTYRIPEVSGIAFGRDGRLLVSAGRRIVELDDRGDVKRTVVRDAGGTIWDIDVTRQGLVAATVGEGRHQVVFFDGRGREVRAVGGKGGRPGAGKMRPASFLDPTGIGVTPSGRFFVAENAAPRRFTRWSARGKLEKQFHGPYYYSGMFGIDEEEPEYVYGDTHGDFIRYRVDYRTGKWEVDHYWIGAWRQSGVPAKWWPRIRRRGGRVYWCSGSGGIVELKEDRVRGVAAVYGGPARIAGGEVLQGNDARGSDRMATWSDLNGDGEKQLGEWNVTESAYPVRSGGPQQGWGCYFDEDFNLFMADWSDNEAGGVWEIPVVEWKDDVPVYRWDRARRVAIPKRDWPKHSGAGARTVYFHGKAAYGFTAAYNAAAFPGVGHGRDWEFLRIGKYDPETGAPVWHAGRRAPGFAASGEMYCPTGPSGKIGDLLFWTDENSLVHVIDDRHGLYVGALLEDVSRGPAPGPYTVWVELFNTRTFRHPGTGRVYLIAASDAIHVFEVLGTGTPIRRMSGRVRLDAAGIAKVKKRLARSEAGGPRTCRIIRARGRVEIDGDLGEFARAEPLEMVIKQDARGTARVMYDERNLYVAFDVADSSPLANAGSDPVLAFKTGDTVDVYLGPTPPAARKDGRPVEGDVHVLFTRQQGRDLAVGYWPASKQKKRREFRSPSGRTVIERVEVLTGAAVASRARQGGYCLEAAVPLSLLGFGDVKPTDEIGSDVAINFSDPAGGTNVAKMFWGRGSAGMVYDIPTEVRLEPDTWGVGVIE